jgi:hypothetical protein
MKRVNCSARICRQIIAAKQEQGALPAAGELFQALPASAKGAP